MSEKKPIHYFQVSDPSGLQNPIRQKCIASVKRLVREGIDTYEMYIIPDGSSGDPNTFRADNIRFERAVNDPNLCYVDTDCYMLKAFYPEKEGKPYFPLYEYIDLPEKFPEPFLFYVNGATHYFQDCIRKGLHDGRTYGLSLELLRGLKDYEVIPSEDFVHCYMSLSGIIERQKSAEYIDALEMEVTAFRTATQQSAITMKLLERLKGR